jgi:outer membrane protein OmpA-like peptidoglycan-associated protein
MLRYVFILLFLFANAIMASAQADTFHLYFKLDDPTINPPAKERIDSLWKSGMIKRDKNIIIVGYADYLGSVAYNEVLSQNRAMNVKDYLSTKGLQSDQIKICMGKGQIMRADTSKEGYAPDRKVDIVIVRANRMTPDTTPKPDSVVVFKKKERENNKLNPFPTGVPVNPAKTPVSNTPITPDSVYKLDRYKPGETFIMNNIYFYPNRHMVTNESLVEMNLLYNALHNNPTVKVQIEGHVCCVDEVDALDDDTREIALSVNRAKYIYEYLIGRGIEADRLKYVGYGRSRPMIKVEKNANDQAKNRRVEVRILEK